ncbi:2Fe-2S iron-sulfur cluster binding domain-containing protein [Parasedimentitalea maritima]|uniref:2Fe-2S iron-sulfur cluster binding domain-containing protein n=1 Tax=Parasedimentitalea maritima TaxID=2578117 RepID=A0ABY2UTA6_9RHOB|nr:2Fe-2S iron-sulfur cluster-binding protein [Zongyanglinia marina]TLP61621.1 2Fe-2S iron-sulfur cluster binding domain-containing protein [Zongyanglinia marina]
MQPNRAIPQTRDYTITRKQTESDNIVSFYLNPSTGACPDFVPGDYLVFTVPDEQGAPVKREYSISQRSIDGLRVTIKHETAPNGKDVPPGIASSYFHDKLSEGDTVTAYGPAGKFALNQTSDRPVVLLSGGVGQTPLLAMLQALAAQGSRETVFIHACEHGGVHALGQEVRDLQSSFDKLASHICYANPRPQDGGYDSSGFVTRALLQQLMPKTPAEYYLCGPGAFMKAMYALLLSLDVDEDLIHYEFFGPATLLKSTRPKSAPTPQAANMPQITFAQSGMQVAWDPDIPNLLELAEEHGVMADYSCRAGTCDTCKTRVTSGEVEYPEEPMERPATGFALLCCAVPKGDVTLDI